MGAQTELVKRRVRPGYARSRDPDVHEFSGERGRGLWRLAGQLVGQFSVNPRIWHQIQIRPGCPKDVTDVLPEIEIIADGADQTVGAGLLDAVVLEIYARTV